MNINATYDSMFYQWPFKHGDKVKLLEEHNGKNPPLQGIVSIEKPNYFWVDWDDKTYSSFGKHQMNKLELI